ncbi:hypothetical protein ABEKA_0651 [Acinetobacter lwoffii]|nr:hypothetical protein ABEKA_0651 [Acinetobacter lwoffii]
MAVWPAYFKSGNHAFVVDYLYKFNQNKPQLTVQNLLRKCV